MIYYTVFTIARKNFNQNIRKAKCGTFLDHFYYRLMRTLIMNYSFLKLCLTMSK